MHVGLRTGAGNEGVGTEEVCDVANAVGVDFAELLCEMGFVEDEDLAVVLVVLMMVLLGTLMVVLAACQPRCLLIEVNGFPLTADPDSMQELLHKSVSRRQSRLV